MPEQHWNLYIMPSDTGYVSRGIFHLARFFQEIFTNQQFTWCFLVIGRSRKTPQTHSLKSKWFKTLDSLRRPGVKTDIRTLINFSVDILLWNHSSTVQCNLFVCPVYCFRATLHNRSWPAVVRKQVIYCLPEFPCNRAIKRPWRLLFVRQVTSQRLCKTSTSWKRSILVTLLLTFRTLRWCNKSCQESPK